MWSLAFECTVRDIIEHNSITYAAEKDKHTSSGSRVGSAINKILYNILKYLPLFCTRV